ncbi:MAG: DUF6206 family protein [Acidimicrobiales bacterium]
MSTLTRPDVAAPPPDVEAIEAVIRRAVDERRRDLVDIVGNGELSIALRWQGTAGPQVVKRVPPFPSAPAAQQYVDLVHRHIDELEAAGVRCVATTTHAHGRADGSVVVYHSQPMLHVPALADHVLRAAPAVDSSHPLVTSVLDRTAGSLGAGVPIDSQFANWYWFEGEPWQLDLTTPLYVVDGDVCFDTTGFVREYPWPVRRVVYRELMKIAPQHADIGFVFRDICVQLYRQGLDPWVDAVVAAARERHGVTVDAADARKTCESDAKFFPTLLKLKRAQRAWVQRTGRRYDTLLPDSSSFGRVEASPRSRRLSRER